MRCTLRTFFRTLRTKKQRKREHGNAADIRRNVDKTAVSGYDINYIFLRFAAENEILGYGAEKGNTR